MPAHALDVPNPADVHALAAVHVDGWRDAYSTLLPERFFGADALTRRRRMWADILEQRSADDLARTVRIVRDASGTCAGFLLIGPTSEDHPARDLSIHALYIARALYGSGAAQALVDDLLGGRAAQLWVADPNPRAQRFYAKVGFARDGAETTDPQLDGLREVRMVR